MVDDCWYNFQNFTVAETESSGATAAEVLQWEPVDKVIFSLPGAKSILRINDHVEFELPQEMPGRWVRFWQKVLLGWKWTRKEET